MGFWKMTVNGEPFASYDDLLTVGESDGGPMVQTDPLAGGEQPARFARGNSVAEIPFVFVKEWSDNKLAADFHIRGPHLWNGVKNVSLTHMAYDGSEAVWDFTNAELKFKVSEPRGPTTIATGVIRGLPVLAP